jgi:hypothetical protein
VSGPVYLGLRIDPAGVVPELNPHDQSGVHRGEDWEKLTVVTPVTASGNNHSPASADVLADANSRVSGVVAAGQADWYQLMVPAGGRLTARVTASGGTLVPLLTLAGPSGQVLIQSDSAIVQYLLPGTYSLSVSAVVGAGNYQLTSEVIQASAPSGPVLAGDNPGQIVAADLNADGISDLVTANGFAKGFANTVSVLLGNGNGTFGPPQTLPVGKFPGSVAVADVNGDGKPDIVAGNFLDNDVSVLLGNGDGTFQPQQMFDVGPLPDTVAVADVNGDGRPDIITSNQGSPASVSVLIGNGDGTFQRKQKIAIASGFFSNATLAVADVNGDGIPDLVTNAGGRGDHGSESVLLGNGDGTFRPPQAVPVDSGGYGLAVADVNGDGKPDIVSDNYYEAGTFDFPPTTLSLLLGNGDGTFQPPQIIPTGFPGQFRGIIDVADVNGDGKPDIVTPYSMLLGNGDGTFQSPLVFSRDYSTKTVADLNGDGKPDLVATDEIGGETPSVLLGNGDGTFQVLPEFSAGFGTYAGVVADVNGDGKPDVVTARPFYNTVSVLLGNGDGAVGRPQTFAAGPVPSAVAVADVNGDGKPDLVTANSYDNTVGVLLGNGDGTFGPQQTFPVGSYPVAVSVADVNGDGKPDIVTPNLNGNTVSVLLGNGDGSFQPQQTFDVGTFPTSVAVADVNGDGKPDIVTPNKFSNTVSVLLGNGNGTFGAQQTFPAGTYPLRIAVADVNGDGKPDIVTANQSSNQVSALLGNGDGTFGPQRVFAVGAHSYSVAVADVNGDGKPDLVTANGYGNTVGVLLGNGDGTFQPQQTVRVPDATTMVAVADLNGDGKPDLVSFGGANGLGLQLGHGDGTFGPLSPSGAVGLRNTPYLADLNGDGLPDSVVLDRSGNILFRKGLRGADSPFAPPVILNPGRPARDLTVLHTASGPVIATADASFDRTLSGPNHFVYTLSLYTVAPNGTTQRTTAFSTTLLPTRIAAADLSGNGLDDLVVANSLDNSIQVAFQQPDGAFHPPITLATGEAPSDLSLVDVSGQGLPDIVVSNQASGDVSVFLNDPSHSFATSYRFRSGTSLYGLDTTTASPTIRTVEQAVSLAAGDFTGRGRNDLVVVNRGSDSFSVLANDGRGGFANPQPARTTSTSDGPEVNAQPGPVVAGSFHGPNQPLDVAILMKDRAEVWIFTGDGHGHFRHTFSVAVGTAPTGLSLVRNPRTGFLDLLVGDPFGDILHLQGKGDGTFQAAGSRVSLAAQDLGNGQPAVLVANQQSDRVTVQAPLPGSPQFVPVVTLADGAQSTLAPGAVQWAKLNGPADPFLDAVVIASGGNSVLVYRGTGFDAAGHPTFAPPQTYFVGNDPVNVTIQDINGDGIPDMLIADRGSNDVATLFGALDAGGHWTATPGPRLNSGGAGPISTTLRDLNGDGIPDLVVTNADSGTLTVLPGVGQGFFNDQNPQSISLPGPADGFSVNPSGIGVVPVGPQLVGFDLANLAAGLHTVFTFPEAVNAAQVLADGTVAVALADGTVEELLPDGFSTVTFEPLTGSPSDPSALDVLGPEVLVTSAGQDQVFVFAAPGVPEVRLPAPLPPTGPVAEATPPSGAPLTLVLTLVADVVPADAPTPGSPTDESRAESATGFQSVSAPTLGRTSDETGGKQEELLDVTDAEPGNTTDVDKELRGLNLDAPASDGDPDGTSSRLSPAVRGPWEAAVPGRAASHDPLPAWAPSPFEPLLNWAAAGPLVSAALASQTLTPKQPNGFNSTVPEAPAPTVAVEGAVPLAAPGDSAMASEAAPAPLVPALAEQSRDAEFLGTPRDWDRDLAFLTAVAVTGLALIHRAGAARPEGRWIERPRGRRAESDPEQAGEPTASSETLS